MPAAGDPHNATPAPEMSPPGTPAGSEPIESLNARLESFIRLALDARSGLSAAEAMAAEHLCGWNRGELGSKPCWEKLKCDRSDCPSHGKPAERCWLQAGTLCGGEVHGDVARKIGSCYQCPVLRDVLADPQRALGENALILAHQLETLTTELHRLAVRDPLTGLRNRRFLEEMVPAQIAAAQRRGATPWLLCVDLDGFKQINDKFGHQEGDEALIRTARMLESAVRATDIVFRTGGDEFVVLVIEGSEEAAARVVRRIREALDRHNAGRPAKRKYTLSASIGAGPLDSTLGLAESLRKADVKMYAEKQTRRVKKA